MRHHALDTIPVRLAPVAGEAIDSWLEAWAHRLRVTVPQLCHAAGIPVPGWCALSGTPWTPGRYAAQFAALSAISGLDVPALMAMTAAAIPGAACEDGTGRVAVPDHWWPGQLGSRYCPACLAENGGRWLLAWRSPWMFACLRHRLLLADTCPGCSATPRFRWRFPRYWPWDLNACRSRIGDRLAVRDGLAAASGPDARVVSRPCGYDLATAPATLLPVGGLVLTAQMMADSLLAATNPGLTGIRTNESGRSRARLGDLFTVARSALRAYGLGDAGSVPNTAAAVLAGLSGRQPTVVIGSGRVVRPDAPTVAFALAVAAACTTDDHLDRQVGSWLAEHELSDARRAGPGAVLSRWQHASPPMQAAILAAIGPRMRPGDQLRYRTATGAPNRPDFGVSAGRSAAVPALFWRGWALRLNPGRFNPLPFREALSILFLLAGSADDFRAAYRAVGRVPPTSMTNATSWLTNALARTGHLDTVIATIARLSAAIDEHGSPIDHRRRRDLFQDVDLDWDLLHGHFDDIGLRRPVDTERRHYRWRLAEILTGNLPHYAPDAAMPRLSAYSARTYEDAAARYRPAVAAHLHHQAAMLLKRAGIDEPVIWEPPEAWLGDHPPDLPGPRPDDIDLAALRAGLRGDVRPGRTAKTLGTSLEHVRVAALRHGTDGTDDLHGYRSGAQRKVPRSTLPGADQLRAGRDAGLTLGQLAEQTGHSANMLWQAARRHNIDFPIGSGPHYLIDPDWLRDQVLGKQRRYLEIAEQLGVSAAQLGALAKKAGITAHPRGSHGHRHPLAAHGGPGAFHPAVWAALDGQKPLPRARNYLAVAGHATFTAAAAAIGTRPVTLAHQIDILEHNTGIALFQRGKAGNGARRTAVYTPAGEHLADQLRETMSLLGTATPQPCRPTAVAPGILWIRPRNRELTDRQPADQANIAESSSRRPATSG